MSLPAEGAVVQPAGGGNLIALGLIQVFRMVSGLLINVMLMQGLGVEGFGIYGYVMILVGMASFGSNLGMDRLLKREISRDEAAVGQMVATGLVASALLSLLTGLGILGWAWVMDGRQQLLWGAAAASGALLLQSLALVPISAFHAVQRMGRTVHGNAAGRLVLVLATAGFLYLKLGVVGVFVAQVLDALVNLLIVWSMYRRHLATSPLRTTRRDVFRLVRDAVPFGLNSLFVSIYLTVDVIMLANLRDDRETGIYRGAVMLLSLFPIVADTLSTGIYPRMSRHLGDREKAAAELGFLTRVLLAISVPAAVGGVLTAFPLMIFLGGEEFGVSALSFMIMAPLLPMRYLNNAFGMTMSALNRQDYRTEGAIYAAVLNISLNLYAIPAYGALGAACVTLLTEVALLLFMRYRITTLVSGLELGKSMVRVGIPAAVMGGVLWLLPPMHVLLCIALGGAVYAGLGLLTGAWHPSDLRRLRRV